MALLFFDGFDHCSNTQLYRKWAGVVDASDFSVSASAARNGAGGIFMDISTASDGGYVNFSGNDTIILGFALKWITSINIWGTDSGDSFSAIAFREGSNNHVSVNFASDGTIMVYKDNSTLLGSSSSGLFNGATWYYLEIKVTVHDSAGIVEIKLDGTTVLNLTGQDTKDGGTSIINSIRIGCAGVSAHDIYLDDLYICDDTGSENNDFLGDVKVETLFPDADGTNSDFTCSSGSDHYALIDENPPNDDTDYNESTAASEMDTVSFDAAAAAGTILGVQVSSCVKKTDAGTLTARNVVRSGASPAETESSDHSPSTDYTYITNIWEKEPVDDVAWTLTKINAAEFGVKRQS